MPSLTTRDSYVLVFDYPAPEVTRFMLDGAEEFHELSQAFFHYVAWSTSGSATLFDLKAGAFKKGLWEAVRGGEEQSKRSI